MPPGASLNETDRVITHLERILTQTPEVESSSRRTGLQLGLAQVAQALDRWALAQGRAITRFDYSGHGESGGEFAKGTIGRWLEESLAVFDACCRGPQVVIGSSMGAWLALLLTRAVMERRERAAGVAGLVLIAPAVDFTEELMWKRFPPEAKRAIEQAGSWLRPSQYSAEPYLITRGLIEDGRRHL